MTIIVDSISKPRVPSFHSVPPRSGKSIQGEDQRGLDVHPACEDRNKGKEIL